MLGIQRFLGVGEGAGGGADVLWTGDGFADGADDDDRGAAEVVP